MGIIEETEEETEMIRRKNESKTFIIHNFIFISVL